MYLSDDEDSSEPEDLSVKLYGCTSSKMVNMSDENKRRFNCMMARYQDNYHEKHINPIEFEIYNSKRRNWDQSIKMRRFADS